MRRETGTKKIKIRKGDKVKIIAGKDIGKEGEVERILRGENRAVVAGVNLVKKFVKRKGEREPGGIITVAAPIHISNLMLICPRCSKPTKVGYKVKEGGGRIRFCRRCGKEVDLPKAG